MNNDTQRHSLTQCKKRDNSIFALKANNLMRFDEERRFYRCNFATDRRRHRLTAHITSHKIRFGRQIEIYPIYSHLVCVCVSDFRFRAHWTGKQTEQNSL